MGRESLNQYEIKDRDFSVRFTEKEYQDILNYCEKHRLKPSTFLRICVRDVHVDTESGLYDTDYIKKVTREKASNRGVIIHTRLSVLTQNDLKKDAKIRGEKAGKLVGEAAVRRVLFY